MQPEREEKQLVISPEQLMALKQFTGRSLCRVIGCIDHDTGEVVGSGTFVEVRGTPYLVTANHVAKMRDEEDTQRQRLYESLAHDTGVQGPIFRIVNPICGYGGLRDVAVARLIKEDFTGTPVVPLPVQSVPKRTPDLKDEIMFVHGFLGKKSRYVRAWQGIVSDSFPWVTAEERTECKWFDTSMHIAVGYATRGLDERRMMIDMPDARGLSGSALWKTNVCARGKLWAPEDAEMVGVVTDWDKGSQTLIATRIEFFWVLLVHVLQLEGAYFRWLDRGKQPGDDWADWFAADNDIQGFL